MDEFFIIIIIITYFTGKWRDTPNMLINMDDARPHDIIWIINFSGPHSLL